MASALIQDKTHAMWDYTTVGFSAKMVQKIGWIILYVALHLSVCYSKGDMARQEILNKLLGLSVIDENTNTSQYDSSIAPDFELDIATTVQIQIFIQNIYSVSESAMDYSLDIFLRQKWVDKRLRYGNMSELEWLELDSKMMSKVWVPDTYFSNEKKASVHDVTVPNKMMHLYRNGTVLYSSRLSLTLSCNMKLQKYPMDDQLCPIHVESYAYTVENVLYLWDQWTAVRILSDVAMPQFEATVDKKEVGKCGESHGENTFACIQVYIRLKRKVGYYIVQVFVPSVLIVVLSWVSFWVDHDAVPARVSLGVLTVLTMTTQSSGARQSLPQVSYVKAIDVWMFTCLLFVFVALVEYSYVNVVARRRTKQLLEKPMELQPSYETGSSQTLFEEKELLTSMLLTQTQVDKAEDGQVMTKAILLKHESNLAARRVDKVSRVVFPLCFVFFNAVFWTYYSLIASSPL